MVLNVNFALPVSLKEISSADGRERIEQVLGGIADRYNLKSVAYLGTGIGKLHQDPYLAVTYSSAWVEHYRCHGYVQIDPVVQRGFRRLLPIDWKEFGRPKGELRKFFGEALEFGLGRQGATIPVHGRGGDKALLTITSDLSDRDWVRAKLEYMRDFQLIAVHIHQKVLQLESGSKPARTLSPRELECLQWASDGKTAWESAIILGLSEHTVRCYLESARYKLNAVSNTHAVSIAHAAGLFFPRL